MIPRHFYKSCITRLSLLCASGAICIIASAHIGIIAHAAPLERTYPWQQNKLANHTPGQAHEVLKTRLSPPRGFERVAAEPGSFADWLRHLPLKKKGASVHLYNGMPKFNQLAHAAIIDIDVGKRDLQQCADAIMRLRAEYLYAKRSYQHIAFNYTSGHRVAFTKWQKGWRPIVRRKTVSWSRRGDKGTDYKNFRKYMDAIFTYAGTYSLSKEMKSVALEDMKIGDVFIQGGFPGHAILVADMAVNKSTGEKRFLLLQSFMPAQDMHILRNPANPLDPWYPQKFGSVLITPEWVFSKKSLKRFKTQF